MNIPLDSFAREKKEVGTKSISLAPEVSERQSRGKSLGPFEPDENVPEAQFAQNPGRRFLAACDAAGERNFEKEGSKVFARRRNFQATVGRRRARSLRRVANSSCRCYYTGAEGARVLRTTVYLVYQLSIEERRIGADRVIGNHADRNRTIQSASPRRVVSHCVDSPRLTLHCVTLRYR